mgnify:CR=1 FL=1
MEELRNNETSEKKETIEPLEVITLEGDENQVAEEKMDSPVIRRGDIYSFEDQEWRVFDVRDKNVNLINLKNNKLRLKIQYGCLLLAIAKTKRVCEDKRKNRIVFFNSTRRNGDNQSPCRSNGSYLEKGISAYNSLAYES